MADFEAVAAAVAEAQAAPEARIMQETILRFAKGRIAKESCPKELPPGWLLKSILDASWRVEIARALDNPSATLADIVELVLIMAEREKSK